MTRTLVAGVPSRRSPNVTPARPVQPRLIEVPQAGGPIVVAGYGWGRTTTFRNERAAVEEMRGLASMALELRDKQGRLNALIEAHPGHPRRAEAETKAGACGWESESAVWLASRIWAALSTETRILLATEGWPGHPNVGAEGCREALDRWIARREVPHAEVPF